MIIDCKVCGCRDEGRHNNWTDGYECRRCGQEYQFTQELAIVLTDDQCEVLREFQQDSEDEET